MTAVATDPAPAAPLPARPAPIVARAELPYPEIVVVQLDAAPRLLLLADTRVPDADVAAAIDDLDEILAGPAYPLPLAG